MNAAVWILGEALMDCVAQPDGTLRPLMGGSPFNMARAAALRGASVGYLNPLSSDQFGQQMGAQLAPLAHLTGRGSAEQRPTQLWLLPRRRG
jgi:fructokinase